MIKASNGNDIDERHRRTTWVAFGLEPGARGSAITNEAESSWARAVSWVCAGTSMKLTGRTFVVSNIHRSIGKRHGVALRKRWDCARVARQTQHGSQLAERGKGGCSMWARTYEASKRRVIFATIEKSIKEGTC